MSRPQDASTTDAAEARVDEPRDAPVEHLVADDEDTVTLSARSHDPADAWGDHDDEEPSEASAPPEPSDPSMSADAPAEQDTASPGGPSDASAEPDDDVIEAEPITGSLARYAATGSIPIIGEAMPVTGSMPVVGPIYPPKSRRPWIITTCVLAVALLGAAFLGWRMWQINGEWQAFSDDLTEANYDLGDQIATERQSVMDKQAEVDLLSERLSASNARLLDVSAEKASALDDQEYTSQVITTLEETLSLGQAATASLNGCIDGLEQLTVYLRAPEDEYDAAQVSDYAAGVTSLCNNADGATSRFQGALTE